MIFSWDEELAEANFDKYGVLFEEARSVFLDEQARVVYGGLFRGEDCFALLGKSDEERLLVVVHVHKEYDRGEIVGILSARRASEKESLQYRRQHGKE